MFSRSSFTLDQPRSLRRGRAAGLAALTALTLAQSAAVRAGEAVPGRLRGEVRNHGEKPVSGVVVLAIRTSAGPASLAITSSDGRGFFGIDGLPAGEYRVETWSPGYAAFRLAQVQVGGPFRTFVDVTLEAGREAPLAASLPSTSGATRMTAQVGDESGHPLSGARLRLDPVGLRADPRRGETDPAGTVILEGIPPGVWRLSIFRAGAQRLTIARLELGTGPVTLAARLLPQGEQTLPAIEDLLPPPQFPDR